VKLGEVADRLHCRLEGDAAVEIRRVAGIERAEPGDLTFIANPKYYAHLETTRASAVILSPAAAVSANRAAILRTNPPDDPYLAFARALSLFGDEPRPSPGIHPMSVVAQDASIGENVSIGPFVAVGPGAAIGARTVVFPNVVIAAGARIGEDCVIHAQVSIRERVIVGDRVIVHDGAVLGSDGFGFAKQPDGTHYKIPQHADVIVEHDVEIGANVTIDRPSVGETRIGWGTKIDNLVHIAHGVAVGRRVLLAAQVGIAGSAVVEDDVILAGQVGVAGHLRIGKGVMATAQTGIPGSVPDGAFLSGTPAISHAEWLKASAVYRQLPDLRRRLIELERRLRDADTPPKDP
jgi:UDP-3-O-[3-hydroxymyristoyl] glucosamine N-acyltransferase